MTTVLVVDDTPSQLELMNIYLQDGGYDVITSVDAKDALLKAENDRPDIILTDVVMPGMSGFEFCRELKRNPVTQRLPIVICSSKNKKIDRIWGMRQGADIYLTKPFSKQELIQALKSISH